MAIRIDTDILAVLFAQHFLYFLPLPHGQGALRPTADIDHESLRIRGHSTFFGKGDIPNFLKRNNSESPSSFHIALYVNI